MTLPKVNGRFAFEKVGNSSDFLSLANGKLFVVSNKSQSGPSGTQWDVWGQYFNLDGTVSSPEFRLYNSAITGNRRGPEAIQLADGNYLVIWQVDSSDASERGTYGTLYDPSGNAIRSNFKLDGDEGTNNSVGGVVPLSTGGFVMVGTVSPNDGGNSTGLPVFRLFDAFGDPASGFTQFAVLDTSAPSTLKAVALSNGKFAMIWDDYARALGDLDGFGIKARIFNSNGTPFSGEFLVNTTTTNFQQYAEVTQMTSGGFAVLFRQYDPATKFESCRLQTFDANGALVGKEVLLSSGVVYQTEIIGLLDGRLLVVYEAEQASTRVTVVKAQVFNANGTVSVPEFLVSTNATADLKSATLLANGNVLVTWSDVNSNRYAQLFDPDRNGTAGNDSFTGTALADIYNGLAGNDWISGLAGDDTLNGDAGDDHLIGGLGADALNGGSGYDFARYDFATAPVTAALYKPSLNTGEAAGDTYTSIEGLVGSQNSDYLYGNASSNQIFGLGGNDWIDGYGGVDSLYGGDGIDSLVSRASGEILDGGAGFDYVRYDYATASVTAALFAPSINKGFAAGDKYTAIDGFVGSAFGDWLHGDDWWNILIGQGGNDSIDGRGGNDQLYGDAGNDILYGGAGNDILSGGTGSDVFRFSGLDMGSDIITDYQDGADKLSIALSLETTFSGLTFTGNGSTSVTITGLNGSGNAIVVQSATAFTLDASDFSFYG
jgi:Ca2+-binding RTX toxin-like protein